MAVAIDEAGGGAIVPGIATRAGRLFVIFMGPSLGGLVPMAIAIAQPAIAAHFGGGDDGRLAARMLFALPSLMIMIGAPVGGALAERFGYRPSLLIALAVYSVAGSAGLVLDDFTALLISRLFLGLAAGAFMALYLALTAAYFEGQARARVMGFAVSCSAAVGVLSLALGGRLVDWGGWQAPFGMYLLGFVTLAIAWATVRRPFHTAARAVRSPGAPGPLGLLAQLWPVYLTLLILSVGTFMPSTGGPFLLKANGIDSATRQSNILSAGGLPAVFSAFAYGFLRRWFSDRALIVLTAGMGGLGMIAAVQLHAAPALLATFVLMGASSGIKAPAVSSVILAQASPAVRAAAAGLSFSCIFLGQFLAPVVIEFISRGFGIHGAFLGVGGTLAVLAVVVAIFGIGRKQPLETAS
jgi:MFS family permease